MMRVRNCTSTPSFIIPNSLKVFTNRRAAVVYLQRYVFILKKITLMLLYQLLLLGTTNNNYCEQMKTFIYHVGGHVS